MFAACADRSVVEAWGRFGLALCYNPRLFGELI